MKRKFKIQRVPAFEFFKNNKTLGINREQAATISKYLNSYKDTTLTVDKILSDTKNYTYITDNDNNIIGAAQLKRKNWKKCSINNLIIDEKYRRQGHGKKLLEQIEDTVGYRGFKSIDALVDEDNEPTIKLLTTCGYTKNIVFYDITSKKYISTWEKPITCPRRKKKPFIDRPLKP